MFTSNPTSMCFQKHDIALPKLRVVAKTQRCTLQAYHCAVSEMHLCFSRIQACVSQPHHCISAEIRLHFQTHGAVLLRNSSVYFTPHQYKQQESFFRSMMLSFQGQTLSVQLRTSVYLWNLCISGNTIQACAFRNMTVHVQSQNSAFFNCIMKEQLYIYKKGPLCMSSNTTVCVCVYVWSETRRAKVHRAHAIMIIR